MSSNTKRTILDAAREAKNAVPVAAGKPATGEAEPGAVVTYACGHEAGVRSIQNAFCPGCQAARRRQRANRKRPPPGRLPDGAVFHAVYDAASEVWSGTLAVPATGAVFSGREPGVHRLLERLGGECFAAGVGPKGAATTDGAIE